MSVPFQIEAHIIEGGEGGGGGVRSALDDIIDKSANQRATVAFAVACAVACAVAKREGESNYAASLTFNRLPAWSAARMNNSRALSINPRHGPPEILPGGTLTRGGRRGHSVGRWGWVSQDRGMVPSHKKPTRLWMSPGQCDAPFHTEETENGRTK